MGVSIKCQCGASLIAPDGSPSIVCARCSRVIAVPQPEPTNIGLSETMLQMPPVVAPQPAPPKPRRWLPFVAIGLALAAVGLGIGVWQLRGERSDPPAPPEKQTPPDKPPPKPAIVDSVPELLRVEHQALSTGDAAKIAALLAPDAFGFGVDASELALDGKSLAAVIAHDLGAPPPGGFMVSPTYMFQRSITMTCCKAAWIVEELDVSGRHFATSQFAVLEPSGYVVVAWHVATLLGNKRAYDLARQHQLPEPAAIQTVNHGDGADAAAKAAVAAFSSRPQFIAAIADGDIAVDLGSAPGEHVEGGAAFRKAFTGMKSELALAGGMRTGGYNGWFAWTAQNVDFTLSGVTERFRVLAVWRRDGDRWTILLTHWSNGGPFP